VKAGRRTLVKICGITRIEDAMAALRAGADWLGFIRTPISPRYRSAEECARLVESAREQATRPFEAVGVYVNPELEYLYEDSYVTGMDRIQFHGDEPMELVRMSPLPAIKALRVRDAESLRQAEDYPGVTLLTDTYDPSLRGGTGKRFDPELCKGLAAEREVILAGGLTPENVAEAVRRVRPFGVDVSSGVEIEAGIKDAQKIADFVSAVREGDGG
jgi:phosphoribosylanthranilate isomerase